MTLKKTTSLGKRKKNDTPMNSKGLWHHAQEPHMSNTQSKLEHWDGWVQKMSHL